MTENLSALEREVERARAKFASDLALLRSPHSYREFGMNLKAEARSVVRRVADDLKARVAANPSAALVIGAGVAWKLLRDPPIAMTLIGAGALSLWRTEPTPVEDDDYFVTAQERFKEQVSQAASRVKDYAAETVQSARESAKDVTSSMVEGAAASVESARDGLQRAAQHANSKVHQAVREDRVRDQLLLGFAGLAVVAALGLAYQDRVRDA